jgi:hypothetical protein
MSEKLWFVGWKKTGTDHPEHEVDFDSTTDALSYLVGELSWLSVDLPTGDSYGNECINLARKLTSIGTLHAHYGELAHWEWTAGDHTYYVTRNEPEARRRKAALR